MKLLVNALALAQDDWSIRLFAELEPYEKRRVGHRAVVIRVLCNSTSTVSDIAERDNHFQW